MIATALLILCLVAFVTWLCIRNRKLLRYIREFQAIHDTVPVGMCKVDSQLNVIWSNRQIRDFYNLPKDVKQLNYGEILSPSLLEIIKSTLRENTALDIITFEGAMNPDLTAAEDFGEGKLWMHASYVPITDDAGKLSFYALINEDRTAEKLSEYRLLEQKQLVQQKLESIEKLNEDLREINVGLENFAAIASHDLKSPLTTISGFAELLERKLGADLDEANKGRLSHIKKSAQEMSDLINELLLFSKVSSNSNEINYGTVSLQHTVEKVIEKVQFELDKSHAKVLYNDLPDIYGNESLIYQIFQNLITNAIKFTAPDTEPVVYISTHAMDQSFVTLKISDNGVGIEADQIDQIFEPFSRGRHDKNYMGTGLGLSICKKIAGAHGGRMWISSTIGIGTDVYLQLPLAEMANAYAS